MPITVSTISWMVSVGTDAVLYVQYTLFKEGVQVWQSIKQTIPGTRPQPPIVTTVPNIEADTLKLSAYDVEWSGHKIYVNDKYVGDVIPGGNNVTITQTFSTTPSYTLTINSTTGGTTDPVPSQYVVEEGATVPVSAIPQAGYMFNHWELDGANVGSTNPITVTMDKAKVLHAVFVVIPPPPPGKRYLTIVAINAQTNPAQGTYEADLGSKITVTATPNSGYHFKEWLLDDVQAGTQPSITVTMDANHTLAATTTATPTDGRPIVTWLLGLVSQLRDRWRGTLPTSRR